MSIKNLVEMIKRNGLLASMPQLEELYQVAIENELKLADSQREFRAADATIENLQMQLNAEREAKLALAAENAGLKGAFSKPDAWLSWHSIPPTFYEPDRGGEYLQVHEKAGEKNDDGSDSWPVYSKPEIETPATDAFLAEVRAQGVEMFAEVLKNSGAAYQREFYADTGNAYIEASKDAVEFAAQLRKGGAS